MAIDAATHEIIGAQVSLDTTPDNEALPGLLNPLRYKLGQVPGDGTYDTKACHKLLRQKQARPTIPPRSNTGYWKPGHPRNEAVNALKALAQLRSSNNLINNSPGNNCPESNDIKGTLERDVGLTLNKK